MTDIDYSAPASQLSVGGAKRFESFGIRPDSIGLRRRLIVAGGLLLADILVIALSREIAGGVGAALLVEGTRPEVFWLQILLLPIIFLDLGLYEGYGPSPVERFRLRSRGVVMFAALEITLSIALGVPGTAILVASLAWLLLLVLGHYGEAVVRTVLIRSGLWGAPAALVGLNGDSRKLAEVLLTHPEYGLRPLALVDPAADPGAIESGQALQTVHSLQALDQWRTPIEVLLFTSTEQFLSSNVGRSSRLPCPRVVVAHNIEDIQSLWLNTRALGGAVGLEIKRNLYLRRNLGLKRVIDYMIALPLSVVALPIIAILAIAIKIVDRGPVFFRQKRVGWNGRTIEVLKLRTMYTDAEQRLLDHLRSDPAAREEWSRHFKLSRDPRILPFIGNLLRRLSLDELPQLFNVIRGDMTLIGPRPFPSYHLTSFDDEFRKLRESVPPGLTGLWQVTCRSDGDLLLQKAQDTYYIRNWSIWLDFYILLETLPTVVATRGAR